MGFGNFLRGVVAQVNPFDRGRTYSDYNPRKRREEEDWQRPSISVRPAPTQRITSVGVANQPVPKPKPVNIFETLNKAITPNAPSVGVVPVVKNYDTEVAPPPRPGMVVRPTVSNQNIQVGNTAVRPAPSMVTKPTDPVRPKQSLTNRFRDVFDANTESDKYRREMGNRIKNEEKDITWERPGNIVSRTPIVGHAVKTLNTLGRQIPQVYYTATGDIEKQNSANDMFAKNDGGLFNAGTLYNADAAKMGDFKRGVTDIAAPTAVAMLDVLTLGKGSAVSEAIKQQGRRALPGQVGNIVQTGMGNFGSGAIDAASQGATKEEAAQSGFLNAILGLGPDIGLPAIARSFRNRVMPRIWRGEVPRASDVVEELDEAAISASAEAANAALTPRPIQVKQNIPVSAIEDLPDAVPVRNTTPSKPIIREVTGDATETTSNQAIRDAVEQTRADAAAAANTGRPDPRIEGVTPRPQTDPGYLTKVEIKAERDALDEALANKEINKTQHKEANKALDDITAIDEAPKGKPIEVKQVDSLTVQDKTVIPETPAKPGTVRVTTKTDPQAAKTQAAASAPVATPPLPREVQNVLDNPKQFSKRQVAAARNQRNLARKMAKVQEETAEALDQLDATSNRVVGQSDGFAPTDKFSRGRKGNVYERASGAAEAELGAREMADRSVDDLLDEITAKESLTAGDRRRISAAKENLMKTDPENFRTTEKYKLLDSLEKSSRTQLGQALALIPRTIRKTANSDALTARWERKVGNVLNDPSRMTDAQWRQVQDANDSFTLARDRAGDLEEQFRRTGSEADYKAWEQAYEAARKADKSAKMTEVKVAQDILKGEKGADVTKTIDNLKKEADVNTMDYITANMLSGTGTGFRNTVGTELAGIENRLFANTRAYITKGLFGEDVGGYSRAGARYGRKTGAGKWVDDIKARAENGGKNPLEWAKNWSTAINSGGEASMQSQVYSRLAKYYRNQFADQGLTGKDLDLRMRHAMITDPDDMAGTYLDATMKASGLTGLFEKGQTIEKAVADYLGGKTDSKVVQGASKLLMRMAVGFPTATGNFIYQSGKRLTLGVPSYIEAGVKAAKGDKMGAALAFERAMKETGSGAAVLGLGIALGSQDMISGAYPEDKEERERWEREGISENSIKLGGAWYPIPQGAGMFGLPLMTGAAIGRGGAEDVKNMYSRKNLAKLLPTDQIQGFLNAATDNGGSPQAIKNMFASSVRAVTPVGALLNQISKSFDDTKNDTTTKDFWSNVLDQVYSGIPGVNNAMDIPDKTDAEGNVIKNPNALELAAGATSAVQGSGEERSKEIDTEINTQVKQIDQYGLLEDPNMEGVLKETGLDAYNKLKSGKQLDESDIKALKEGLVKGVSSEGTDTAYLEREQYDTNLAVLKLKRDMMKEDVTTKPSSLKDIDTAIARGEVYKDNQIPYKDITDYKEIGVEEWRDLGDPDNENYSQETQALYDKLWKIDQLMTEKKVSYKKGDLEKQKYYLKDSGKGKGGRGGGGGGSGARLGTDFGTLKSSGPTVQQYESIKTQTGGVPRIQRTRSNINHKIVQTR